MFSPGFFENLYEKLLNFKTVPTKMTALSIECEM